MRKLMRFLMVLAVYILAVGPVWADGDGPEVVKPDQTDIKFTPYPKDDKPEEIAKGTTESFFLRPVNSADVVYYRILSVAGADQTSPISEADTKVETQMWGAVSDYVPIKVGEDLVNANSQFVVKAAALHTDGTWSTNVTAAYNVVFGEFVSEVTLAFVSGKPTEFMVGESYEMQLSLKAPADSLARYGNRNVQLLISPDLATGIDFANVEYKFAANDGWTSVDPDDLQDIVRIPNTFQNFVDKGVWVKLTMARKKKTDALDLMMCIALGNSFLDAVALSSPIYLDVPCVLRPAADPTFSPAAGYIDKGSTVTITSTAGAAIYYTTDGTEPTTASTQYENPVVINGMTAFKAIAVKDGITSFLSEAVYSVVGIPQVTPVPAPYTGYAVYDSLVEITLKPETEGAKIYYTTDGTEPTAASTEYTAPFKLRTETLKVIAMKDDGDQSQVVTVSYRLRPAPPTASPAPVRENNKVVPVPYGSKVKLACMTEGAEIYWRIGGSGEITTKDNKYTGEIELKEASSILKAAAFYKDAVSQQVSFTYRVMLADPEFSLQDGEVPFGARVTLTSKSVEANTDRNKTINIAYTTDGTEPTKENVRDLPKYTGPIELTETVTIKAMTWTVGTQGLEVSNVSTATYTVKVEPVEIPVINPAAGAVEKGTKVTIACETEGAVIYYTVDGTEPTAESTQYKEAIEINEAVTVKAIAIKGNGRSEVAEAAYTVKEKPEVDAVAKPVFSIAPGAVKKGTQVSIACETEDAVIYYTVDGSEPTAESIEYKAVLVINEAITIKAIAILGELKSEVAEAAYTIKTEGPSANEDEELAGVSVYPNPSNGLFNIELPVEATVEVLASNGVLIQRVKMQAGGNTLSVNRSGIYFLRIAGEGRATVKRVVVR